MLDNKFQHKLPTQKIIVRQDKGNDERNLDEVGYLFPLIRIGDVTFEKDEIKSFRLNVGESLLPTISLTIDDSDMNFRGNQLTDEFVKGDSMLTVYISITADSSNEKIKNDYKITSISGISGSKNITFNAVLYVPKMAAKRQWGYNGNSLNAIKEIAKFSDLGFTTNITQNPTDNSLWLTNTSLIDLLRVIEKRSSIENDCIIIYVDAFANLTVLQLSVAIEDTTQYFIENDPSGKKVNPIKLVISNKSEKEEGIDDSIPLNSWTSNSNMEKYLKNYTLGVYSDNNGEKFKEISIQETEINTSLSVEGVHKLDNGRYDRDSLHSEYGFIEEKNRQIRDTLTQGTRINFKLDRYNPNIFIGGNFDFYIEHSMRNSTTNNQKEEIGTGEAVDKSTPQSGIIKLKLSGKFHILDLQYVYKRNSPMYITGTGLRQ